MLASDVRPLFNVCPQNVGDSQVYEESVLAAELDAKKKARRYHELKEVSACWDAVTGLGCSGVGLIFHEVPRSCSIQYISRRLNHAPLPSFRLRRIGFLTGQTKIRYEQGRQTTTLVLFDGGRRAGEGTDFGSKGSTGVREGVAQQK